MAGSGRYRLPLPVLGTKDLTSKKDFLSLPVLSEIVENEHFNCKCPNSYSEVCTQRMLHLTTKLIF